MSDLPSRRQQRRPCLTTSSNWLSLGGKQEPDYHVEGRAIGAPEQRRDRVCGPAERTIFKRSTRSVKTPLGAAPASARLFSADLLRPLQLLDQLRDRDRRQRCDLHRATRAQVDREMRDGRIVGGLDDGNEIMRAQQRVL